MRFSKFLPVFLFLLGSNDILAQYWQQKIKYNMNVQVNVTQNTFTGKQLIEYTNQSPDTLKVLYFHLYWNAFQPNSMMDNRSRELGKIVLPNGRNDWDLRVRDRIQKLEPDETGYQKVNSIKINGAVQKMEEYETILKVMPDRPLLPGSKTMMEVQFEARVPVQIRRSGRDNAEGVRYSMSQWYPKLCEYDREGWHPTPYVAREFYGVWGDFDVSITIDKNYIIAGTGYLQNPEQIGYGYEKPGTAVKRPAGNTLTWRFTAPNVHDFVWAADPEYKHISKTMRDGLVLHAFYKIKPALLKKQYESFSARQKERFNNSADKFVTQYQREWETVLELAAAALPFMDAHFGKYPYKQYSFIQGGDGGMEYPMATLLKGANEGVVVHEWLHSWYQMILGTNESLYAWMDEGFTSYAESRTLNFLADNADTFPHKDAYTAWMQLAKSGLDEPLTTHADQYNTNYAYSTNAYSKGEVFMEQLGYITGAAVRDQVLLSYFDQWKFKHPNANDFIRVAENVSGLQLDWYKTFFVNTNKTIDYKIDSLWEAGGKTLLRISRVGAMPMPVDCLITYADGSTEMHYIPLSLMYGAKQPEDTKVPVKMYKAWNWTVPTYTIETDKRVRTIKKVEIDPSYRLADMERKNNKLELNW
jgi:hypothetical protein